MKGSCDHVGPMDFSFRSIAFGGWRPTDVDLGRLAVVAEALQPCGSNYRYSLRPKRCGMYASGNQRMMWSVWVHGADTKRASFKKTMAGHRARAAAAKLAWASATAINPQRMAWIMRAMETGDYSNEPPGGDNP